MERFFFKRCLYDRQRMLLYSSVLRSYYNDRYPRLMIIYTFLGIPYIYLTNKCCKTGNFIISYQVEIIKAENVSVITLQNNYLTILLSGSVVGMEAS